MEKVLTEALHVIYSRRAVRQYRKLHVERDLITQIIDAGRMAPSAMNQQPWRFYVLTHRDIIQAFSDEITAVLREEMKMLGAPSFLHSQDPIFHDAPVVIFVSAPANNEWAGLDIGMCAQNMMLAAKALGLDTCPVGLAKFVTHTKIYSRLHVPDGEEVLLAIIVGYGDEFPEVHERKGENISYIS